MRAARAQVTAPSPTTSGVRSTALLTSPRCVCVYIALMVCHGASHKSGLSQPRARANIPCDIYTHNAAPTPSPRFGGQHAFSACRKASSPTAGHSAAVCCNLLSDLCRLLPPPCIQTVVCVPIRGGSHWQNWRCCHTVLPHVVARKHNQRVYELCSCFLIRARASNRPVLRPRVPQGPLKGWKYETR